MSKLIADRKTIKELFNDKKADFLIPDYQRPYAWEEEECQTLWKDIFDFAFPDEDCNKFNSNSDEYFLGPIVIFKNHDEKLEVIDGQQRLTTLMLLLRAFYAKYGNNMRDDNSRRTRENIEKCIWKTDEFGKPDKNALKIDSEVATDGDKGEFLRILRTGTVDVGKKNNYSENYAFFQKRIDEFLNDYPAYFSYLPTRILNNCVLLPIEAESQDTALRIFSTLNDRGKPLSDADIFKAQLYKFFSSKGKKSYFIDQWKNLEELCEQIFHPTSDTPMDELFTRYMYYERAKSGNKNSSTEALRKFYEKDGYILLKSESTFENLIDLAHFWQDISNQDTERFSDRVLRRLFVLSYAPNSMWTYFVSVYYMCYRDENGFLDDERFYAFLNKITAFIWTYAITNPGVNALRIPVYAEMIQIVSGAPVTFSGFKFEAETVKSMFCNFNFSNGRPITKSFLAWWAFHRENQKLLSTEKAYEIEHIFSKNRQLHEKSLKNEKNLECLGNKALLEKRINIRASDYHFQDKKKYYLGYQAKKAYKSATGIQELLDLASNIQDFTEADIIKRNQNMINSFIEYLRDNDLMR